MAWLPGLRAWLPGAGIMLAAALAALLAHWTSVRIVPHVPVPGRARGFVRTFVASTTGPSRLAVVLGALWAFLPWVSFPA